MTLCQNVWSSNFLPSYSDLSRKCKIKYQTKSLLTNIHQKQIPGYTNSGKKEMKEMITLLTVTQHIFDVILSVFISPEITLCRWTSFRFHWKRNIVHMKTITFDERFLLSILHPKKKETVPNDLMRAVVLTKFLCLL